MWILIVNHQLNRMHPGVPGNARFPEGAVLAKGVKPFGMGISCCYPYFWVKRVVFLHLHFVNCMV